MLTSSREERDLVESYELGVNAYVVKPVGLPRVRRGGQGAGPVLGGGQRAAAGPHQGAAPGLIAVQAAAAAPCDRPSSITAFRSIS